jgi:hypothetical protein
MPALAISACSADSVCGLRGSLRFTVEYRAVPLHTKLVYGDLTYPVSGLNDQDARLNGGAMGPDLRLTLYKTFIEACYSLRIRYDHLYYQNIAPPGVHSSVNAWMSDHLFYLRFNLPMRRSTGFGLTLGYGFMNRGSKFAYDEVEVLSDGSVITYTYSSDFYNSSLIAGVAFSIRRAEIGIMGYYNAKPNPLFDFPSPYWLPTAYLSYRLHR